MKIFNFFSCQLLLQKPKELYTEILTELFFFHIIWQKYEKAQRNIKWQEIRLSSNTGDIFNATQMIIENLQRHSHLPCMIVYTKVKKWIYVCFMRKYEPKNIVQCTVSCNNYFKKYVNVTDLRAFHMNVW